MLFWESPAGVGFSYCDDANGCPHYNDTVAMHDNAAFICAFFDAYPKLKKFHATMKALPALAPYFASAPYASWAQNNGLFTHFTGQPASFDYGPSVSETITF